MSQTRREKRKAAIRELITAVRNLINITTHKLVMFRRLFGYRMNRRKWATYQVVQFYAKNPHPGNQDWVPTELIEAYVLLGLKKFTQAKTAGEMIKVSEKTADDVEKRIHRVVEEMFPRQHQSFDRRPRFRNDGWQFFSQRAYRMHPYASPSSMRV